MKVLLSFFFVISFIFSSACGTGGGRETTVYRTEYPEGPYSVKEDGVIKSEEFILADGTAISFEDLHLNPDNKILLLATAAGWCGACREEQPVLEEIYQDYKDKGLVVMVTIFEKVDKSVADIEMVKRWVSDFNLTFPVVLDKDFVMKEYYDEALTPMSLMVDLDTMKIIRLNTGFEKSSVIGILDAKL